jgi:1-aminocyclopropane-1-carboxylate deaminase/D-cysteine desulfhydrase-like pyridoxal-dependent ACC family enzyme
MSLNTIQSALSPFPDSMLSLPTPIQHLKRLSLKLGSNIYIKREDLTGFGLGGNKIRKLDFLIADAIKKNANTVITKHASAFSRNAALACKAMNIEFHVAINGSETNHNRLCKKIFAQSDVQVHYFPDLTESDFEDHFQALVKNLSAQGKIIEKLHPGGSDKIGTLGYVKVFDEIVHFSTQTHIHFDHIIHATGSAGTAAGLLIGQNLSKYPAQLTGMAISQDAGTKKKRILDLADECSQMLNMDLSTSCLTIDDAYIGPGYPISTIEGGTAVKLFGNLEGIFLDSVYTGKAAAGMIDYIEKNQFTRDDNILFIHTGGNSGIYY